MTVFHKPKGFCFHFLVFFFSTQYKSLEIGKGTVYSFKFLLRPMTL